ncbi:Ribosome recycling factor [Handroanthus impetiginosus]|uniref:Ribosome-recycling factor, chloroplastic n=1 Tax=Handroanthus impetiginosus TaxID=429701 RepID=A0A2G9G2H5_9LAMI|nr:Ribosome recycling factor [Handroanthus impetiginosus]
MAISLRRALISSKNLYCALRIASIRSHQNFSYLNSTYFDNSHECATVDRFLSSPATRFRQFNARRGFAKGRKQQIKEEVEEEDEEEEEEWDDEEDDEEGVDLGDSVKTTALSQMEAAVDALSRELAKLRTGRASAGMLDHIMVEHYGVKTPLNRMAVVSVLDSKTLSVTPYDPNALKELEKAIISSPLGLNPKSDNQRLITPIPPLTKEHMQAVCKVVAKSSEDVKQSIRRARQKALDTIKKAAPKKKDKDKAGSSISEDDAKRLEKEIDELTKKFIKTAEDMCKAKEKEIKVG